MPQFSGYPLITSFVGADIFLLFQSSSAANKTITGDDLVSSVRSLLSKEFSVTSINSATVLSDSNEYVICNSGGAFTVTLPDSAANPGKPFYISNKGAGPVNIAPVGADTIIGQASLSLTQYHSVILISDGLGMWSVFGVSS